MKNQGNATLLVHLKGPMQSWGCESKFSYRRTEYYPTKSGVVGLIAAALGIKRNEDEKIQELATLKMGTFTVMQGQLMRDYHMAHEEKFWEKHDGKYTHITHRYYLTDAHFVVGLHGQSDQLDEIEKALKNPYFPLYLGRRACPPSHEIFVGLSEKSLKESLCEEACRIFPNQRTLPIVIEAQNSGTGTKYIQDVPISFNPLHRKYGFRAVEELIVNVPSRHSPLLEDAFEQVQQSLE